MKKKTFLTGASLVIALAACGCSFSSNAAGDNVISSPHLQEKSDDFDWDFKIAYKEVQNTYDGKKKSSDAEKNLEDGVLFEGKYAVLMMDEDSDYKELCEAINKHAEARIKEQEKITLETTELAKSAYEDAVDNDYYFYGPYSYYENVNVIRADDTLASTVTTIDEFYGGPHSNINSYGFTYDTQTGEELKIGDVLSCTEDELNEILAEELHAIEEDEDQFYNLEDALSHYKFEPEESNSSDSDKAEYPYNWYFAKDGIHFIFNVYEITSYNYGASDVVIGYDEYEDVIDEKYIPDDDSNYVTYHTAYDGSSKADENGIKLEFVDDGEHKDGYTPEKALILTLDGKSETIKKKFKSYSTIIDYYYVHKEDGKEFIYVVVPEEDESYTVFTYDITDGDIEAVGAKSHEISTETLENGYTLYPSYTFRGRELMGR